MWLDPITAKFSLETFFQKIIYYTTSPFYDAFIEQMSVLNLLTFVLEVLLKIYELACYTFQHFLS